MTGREARAKATKQRLVRKKLRVNSTKPDVPTARSFTHARQVVSSFASHTRAQEGATKTSAPWHVCVRTACATALKLAQHTADSDAKDLEILRSARSLLPKADIASRLLVPHHVAANRSELGTTRRRLTLIHGSQVSTCQEKAFHQLKVPEVSLAALCQRGVYTRHQPKVRLIKRATIHH